MGICESADSKYKFNDLLDSGDREAISAEIWKHVVDTPDYLGLKMLDLDFENLIFEGGGCKGIGYCGAIKALDDLGILKKIKRFAGTSAGSYIAMKLAIGTHVDDVLINSMANLQEILYDSNKLGFLINILNKFGWHSGKNLLEYIRQDVAAATGSPDTTFYQLYKKTGRELCVVITNVSTASVEYCHPKTTPDMSIAQAVRTSMSIPILMQPFIMKEVDINNVETSHLFCDGGLVDNYPIRAFDGWYLSMKKEDSFFHKIGEKECGPFEGDINQKTLGFLLFNALESEHFEEIYIRRYGDRLIGKRPDTKLTAKRSVVLDQLLVKKQKRADLIESSRKLLEGLASNDLDKSGDISLNEFKKTMNSMKDDPEMKRHLQNIFGTDVDLDWDLLFEEADVNCDKSLSFTECLHMLQKKGVPLRQLIDSSVPNDIDNMADYLTAIVSALDYRVRSLTERPDDVARTVGIYTDYIGSTDFEMQIEDKIYAIKQGWLAAVLYFQQRLQHQQGGDHKAILAQSKSLPPWILNGAGGYHTGSVDEVDATKFSRKTIAKM